MFGFFKHREFIVDERDVTTVLKAINSQRKCYEYELGNCGWANEPSKWYIFFNMSNKKFARVVKELLVIGSFKMEVRGNMVDFVFTRKAP